MKEAWAAGGATTASFCSCEALFGCTVCAGLVRYINNSSSDVASHKRATPKTSRFSRAVSRGSFFVSFCNFMSIWIDARPTAAVTAAGQQRGIFPDKEGQILSDPPKEYPACTGRQHWPEEIPRKSFLFHTIHSAAPTFGIDPARRQRVDSSYSSKPLVSQKFSSSQQLHQTAIPRDWARPACG